MAAVGLEDQPAPPLARRLAGRTGGPLTRLHVIRARRTRWSLVVTGCVLSLAGCGVGSAGGREPSPPPFADTASALSSTAVPAPTGGASPVLTTDPLSDALVHRAGAVLMDVDYGADARQAAAVWGSCRGRGGTPPCQYAITRTTDGWAHSTALSTVYPDAKQPAISELVDGSTLVSAGDIPTFSWVSPNGMVSPVSTTSSPQTVGPTSPLSGGLGLAYSTGDPVGVAVFDESTKVLGPLAGASTEAGWLDFQQDPAGALWTITCPTSPASPCRSLTSTDGGSSWHPLNSYPQPGPVTAASIAVTGSTYTSLTQTTSRSGASNTVTVYAGQDTTTSGTPPAGAVVATGAADTRLVSAGGTTALAKTDESTGTSTLQTVDPSTGALGRAHPVNGQIFTNLTRTVTWTDGLTTVGVFSPGFATVTTVSPR